MSTKRIQRNLTIMFTDISGFTRHTEKISRDQLMNRLETHNKLLMPIVAHFEGKVIKTIGDSFLITFESPTNAVQCGTYMQYTLRKYNQGLSEQDQIHIKVSINSGDVTLTDTDVFGDAVNVAAKIEKATNPDEIYFTETVFLAMNKAEVPNAFVKTFRPRGENSQEIKLYKVVQDPADEVYKRIVEETRIDPDKMKTRIIELSATAEKEYTRYHEALEALMEAQGKSSKTTMIVLAAGVVLLCAVLLIGFFILRDSGPTPEQVVLADARTLMANGKPGEARRTLEVYIKEHGESADLKDALELATLREKQDAGALAAREFDDLEKEIVRLVAQGKPDVARDRLKAAVVGAEFTKRADALKEQVEHYLAARKAIEEGDAQRALSEVRAAFGETDPSDEIKGIREKANAVIRARKLLSGEDARDNGAAVVGILVKAFGDNMTGPVLELLSTAIEYDLCVLARKDGKDATLKVLDAYRTRFALPGATVKQITREVRLNALWYFTTTYQLKQQVMRTDFGEFGQEIWRLTYQDYPDQPDFLWRLGDTLYAISDACYRTPLGFVQWARAYWKEPAIIDKHPEFYDRLMEELHDVQSAGISNSMREEGITEPIYDARFFLKKFYFKKARPALIAGLTALRKKSKPEDKDVRDTTFNANCFSILADKGEAGVLENRFEFFRDVLVDACLRDNVLQIEHIKALFAEPMTFEEYKQYRELIDDCRRETIDGRYQSYSLAKDMIEAWQAAIREAQPQHTEAYR
ncbi:MAG: hypothetical protein BroJett014_08430 [Planctomycetota bacterium]|nr:hypothetical protein [Planctomycetota bacterium]GIK51870.1 MAG: hypothetical protein BroJett014_08430 [Planctomycetota bacterium]